MREIINGAGLNAIPLLEEYRRRPTPENDILLRTAMGATLGQLTNIDELGQASMGFHGDPGLMRHDPYRWRAAQSKILSAIKGAPLCRAFWKVHPPLGLCAGCLL